VSVHKHPFFRRYRVNLPSSLGKLNRRSSCFHTCGPVLVSVRSWVRNSFSKQTPLPLLQVGEAPLSEDSRRSGCPKPLHRQGDHPTIVPNKNSGPCLSFRTPHRDQPSLTTLRDRFTLRGVPIVETLPLSTGLIFRQAFVRLIPAYVQPVRLSTPSHKGASRRVQSTTKGPPVSGSTLQGFRQVASFSPGHYRRVEASSMRFYAFLSKWLLPSLLAEGLCFDPSFTTLSHFWGPYPPVWAVPLSTSDVGAQRLSSSEFPLPPFRDARDPPSPSRFHEGWYTMKCPPFMGALRKAVSRRTLPT
jgi:hypothetical protein